MALDTHKPKGLRKAWNGSGVNPNDKHISPAILERQIVELRAENERLREDYETICKGQNHDQK